MYVEVFYLVDDKKWIIFNVVNISEFILYKCVR